MMKAIMYHYVRPDDPSLPHFRHLHVEDFAKQLDYFGNEYGFVEREAFRDCLVSGEPAPGVVLTFDDGFTDHFKYVLPELTRRGLWGIFYVATAPYVTGKMIDVHRIHMLLGRFDGDAVAETLRDIITDEMLSHAHVEEFRRETYSRQQNSAATNYVKRLLNYFIDYRYRQMVLDELMWAYFPDEAALVENFYMPVTDLKQMHAAGMILGSHTVNHPVMSKLSRVEQQREIRESFELIDPITGDDGFKTFCYPYGGFHSFTEETEVLLAGEGCRFSFNVESRDIGSQDLQRRPQALPRFDCNQFPHGSVRAHDAR